MVDNKIIKNSILRYISFQFFFYKNKTMKLKNLSWGSICAKRKLISRQKSETKQKNIFERYDISNILQRRIKEEREYEEKKRIDLILGLDSPFLPGATRIPSPPLLPKNVYNNPKRKNPRPSIEIQEGGTARWRVDCWPPPFLPPPTSLSHCPDAETRLDRALLTLRAVLLFNGCVEAKGRKDGDKRAVKPSRRRKRRRRRWDNGLEKGWKKEREKGRRGMKRRG